ncbi:MAG TPA: ABC transporter permease [Vicinamibacterales bacterium]|nr:ABC transporter permease [Vicinamibacterales bacterium]
MRRLLRRVARLFWRRRDAEALREELAFHIDEDADDRVAAGASPDTARRAAQRELGNATLVMEDTRAVWTWPALERLVSDVRYAVRRAIRAPVFSLVAIVSLALGIGANAAVFSLYNAVLLRPLPVPDASELVNLSTPGDKSGSISGNRSGSSDNVFSYPMFRDLDARQEVLTGVAGHWMERVNLAAAGSTAPGQIDLVSSNYFSVLQLTPLLGRLFGPDDDRSPGGAPVVVLTHDYWLSHFNGASNVIGQTVVANGITLTVIGVAPDGFAGTTVGAPVDAFAPITLGSRLDPGFFNDYADRRWYWVYAFGRLEPGVSIDAARTSLNGLYHAILTNIEAPLRPTMDEATRARFVSRPLGVEPGAGGQSRLRERAPTAMLMLFAVTAVVLLIACANLANLLLARSAARTAEFAVRASIGASRGRLVGQLLIEACTLSAVGGVAGLALGQWLLAALAGTLAPIGFPIVDTSLDWRVLAFAVGASLATGLVFGVFPALHATRIDLAPALKDHGARSTGAHSAARFRATMIFVQMALATVLLVSAGLFIRSFVNVGRVDVGIDVDRLVTFTIYPRLNGYTADATRDLLERAETALAAMPGVERASASTIPLVSDNYSDTNVNVEGSTVEPDHGHAAAYSHVGPGFFKTTGIRLLAGRDITAADGEGAPKIAVVNEAFARKFHLGANPLGKRMGVNRSGATLDTEIVGVAADAIYDNVTTDVPAVFYTPYRQDEHLGSATLYVRTSIDPAVVLKSIPTVMARLDPNLPLEQLRTMADQVRVNENGSRVIATLAVSFAALATLLASIGLYGVLAYTVSQRTREFGVRMALGAAPGQVRRLVLRQVAGITIVAAVVGVGGALLVGKAVESLLFRMNGHDPSVITAGVGVLLAVALAAGAAPAWRASRIDPIRALRYE